MINDTRFDKTGDLELLLHMFGVTILGTSEKKNKTWGEGGRVEVNRKFGNK